MRNFNFDAQAATSFVVEQAAHIETEVNRTVYPEIQYPGLVPVDTSAHPMTQTVVFYSSDMFGKADWINGNSDDIPNAGTERTQFQSSVYTAGIGYSFGWEEVQRAQRDGINLQAEDAMAARRAYEEMVDRVAFTGDVTKNMFGLFNYPGIVVAAIPNGDWDNPATTEDEMLADINAMILGVATDTQYTSIADTILLPPSKIMRLATKRLGDTTMTVMEFLSKNNVYTLTTGQALTFRGVLGLETAGAGNTARMIAYRRNPQVLKMHIPMPHRFFPVWQSGPLRWDVPGVFRLGGLDIRRPKEVRYGDGI